MKIHYKLHINFILILLWTFFLIYDLTRYFIQNIKSWGLFGEFSWVWIPIDVLMICIFTIMFVKELNKKPGVVD